MGSASPIKICINGAAGRMGRRLCYISCEDKAIDLVGCIVHPDESAYGKKISSVDASISSDVICVASLKDVKPKPDVIIDFSAPKASLALVEDAVALNIPVVVGTTGLNDDETTMLHDKAQQIPMIHAMNYSIGVNLLFRVAAQVASSLGEDFNIEIVEGHHNKKVDAPSGTAYGIADSICAATNRTRKDLVHGREGQTGQRTSKEIGMHALRLGGVVGDHTVYFGSEYERIELTHKAEERDVFAAGAVRAAKWLSQKRGQPHLYSMMSVLGFDEEDNTTKKQNTQQQQQQCPQTVQ